MKAMKVALIIIICLIVLGIAFYAYYGGFAKLNIRVEEQGGETIVYNEMKGDYSQSAIMMDKIYNLLKSKGIETFKGFGIYYDNPQKVEKSKLRSEVGCIVESKDLNKISTLSGTFKVKILPKKNYIVTEFPFKGKMSVMVSLMKVYPSLGKFTQEKGLNGEGAVMEIYDMPNGKILYRKEILETNK